MSSPAQEVVIIGGSLAGLFTAVTVKSLPNVSKVTILERYQIEDLQDLGAGIRCNQEANDAILEFAHVPPEKYGTLLTSIRFLDKQGNVTLEQNTATYSTTWGQLYRTFRELVDEDTKSTYHHGYTLVNLQETQDGRVVVEYEKSNKEKATILADVVIGADGASSKVRSLLDAVQHKRTSAGYVCYRGVLPMEDLSPTAVQTFHQAGTFSCPPASQFVSYTVPSNEAPADRARKCVNWVWYRNKTEEHLRQLLTDTSGKLHNFTLPHGKMRAEERDKINQQAREELPSVCFELVEKTTEPFIQVVTDSMASKTSFFGGKLLLVGDAVGGQRPHTASAILQGSHHAILVRKYLEGQLDAAKLEEETLRLSRILVEGGQELGKIVMNETPGQENMIAGYMKVYIRIQTELNNVWRETIGIGNRTAQM